MATSNKQEIEMWIAWTHDAMRAYEAPDDIDPEDLVDDMVSVSTQYADEMLEEFESRFVGEQQAPRRTRRKRRKGSGAESDK